MIFLVFRSIFSVFECPSKFAEFAFLNFYKRFDLRALFVLLAASSVIVSSRFDCRALFVPLATDSVIVSFCNHYFTISQGRVFKLHRHSHRLLLFQICIFEFSITLLSCAFILFIVRCQHIHSFL